MKRTHLFIISLVLVVLLIPTTVLAQGGGNSYTITVRGQGSASGRPDLIAFEVGAEAVDLDSITAYNQVGTQLATIRAALVELEIAPEDIQLLTITLVPEDRVDGGQAPTGEFLFRARGALHVVVRDPEQLKLVLASTVRAGASSVQNFTFAFDDSISIEEQARTAAIENASQRAEQMAGATSVAVGDPLIILEESVDVSFAGQVPPDAEFGISAAPLAAGSLTVTVTVQITYALRSSR